MYTDYLFYHHGSHNTTYNVKHLKLDTFQ